MNWLMTKMKWVMLVSGVLTCTMVYAAVASQASLRSTFGESLEGPLAEIVVRNWGALIALVGAMLIYGAFHSPVRPLVLTVAGLSKVIFIGLVLTHGSQPRTTGRPRHSHRSGHGIAVRGLPYRRAPWSGGRLTRCCTGLFAAPVLGSVQHPLWQKAGLLVDVIRRL